jgi:predicted aspartyl protease
MARDNPTNARAYSVLGMTMLNAGRFDDARRILDKALSLNRKEALAWAGWGMLDFYENKVDTSLGSLQEAIHHDPRDPDFLFTFAQVSSRFERYAEAAEAYRRFLDISGKMDKDRRERILGLISFLDYLGQLNALNRPGSAMKTSVPIELVGDRPVLTVKLNGKDEPLRFVLDTGSGMCILSLKTAKRLKIKPVAKGGHARGLGGTGKFEIVYGLLNAVGIGDVVVKNVPVYIRELHDRSQKLDGYIGLSLISKFLTTVDYGSSVLTLDRTPGISREIQDAAATSLPLRLTSSGFLSGEVELEGVDIPLNFIVDTGASISVISNAVANENGISPYVNDKKILLYGSAGVTTDVASYQLPSVTFGKQTRKDVAAIALDLGIINETAGFEQSGILGGNFLKNYKLMFDFRNSRVTFTPIVPGKE